MYNNSPSIDSDTECGYRTINGGTVHVHVEDVYVFTHAHLSVSVHCRYYSYPQVKLHVTMHLLYMQYSVVRKRHFEGRLFPIMKKTVWKWMLLIACKLRFPMLAKNILL